MKTLWSIPASRTAFAIQGESSTTARAVNPPLLVPKTRIELVSLRSERNVIPLYYSGICGRNADDLRIPASLVYHDRLRINRSNAFSLNLRRNDLKLPLINYHNPQIGL